MPRERDIPGTADDWLTRAKSDLALAGISLPPGVRYEDLCYHSQQAAEKAIKAVYRTRNIAFRYTHDLADLLERLIADGVKVPETVLQCIDLTEYAWQARYPSTAERVTEDDYSKALAMATEVVRWADALIEAKK